MALGWAFISTGGHPDNNIAPALKAAKDADLVAVYSRDKGRGEAFAEKHGAKAAYDSIDALLSDSRVDAVFVSSPNNLHAAVNGLIVAFSGGTISFDSVSQAVSTTARCGQIQLLAELG